MTYANFNGNLDRMKRFFYILIFLPLFLLTGCEKTTTTTTTSSVAKLSGFTFAKNDSMPGLAAAVFTIDERLDTGLVWNKDSMLFGTRLDSVVPRFTFAATPGAASLKTPDTTCVLTGYDTLNFAKLPIYLTITSSDGTNTKVYEIRPTVHQVDPDLYTWTQLTDRIYPEDDSEQRVVELGDNFVMLANNGWEIHTFSSADGVNWTALGEPTGLPAGTKVLTKKSGQSGKRHQENRCQGKILHPGKAERAARRRGCCNKQP